jgi:hypothetical protein
MKNIPVLILSLFVIYSCKKENSETKWEDSFGQGNALFVTSAPDSGIIACGILDNKPYLIKLSKDKTQEADYKSGRAGLFSSVWPGNSFYITGGSSDGKMLLARIDNEGTEVWDTVIAAGFNVDRTDIKYTGNGTLLAVGTASAELTGSGAGGLSFIRFDTAGHVIENKEITETELISAERIFLDNQGNIFLPLTRQVIGAKTRASVAKYNSDFQKLWETVLSNNPGFSAASYGVTGDGAGNIYVAGKTEVSKESGTLDNSFLVSLGPSGTVRWKKYLENANTGTDLMLSDNIIIMLNRNCFVVNVANTDDGAEADRVRMFEVCDPYDSDAKGSSLDLHYDGSILVGGKKGNSFYIAMKPFTP